jgi:hypothetical protein
MDEFVMLSPAHDPVNNPSHYQSADGIECIDAIHAALGSEGLVAYCRAAVIKYMWRADKKGSAAENFRKAEWYARRAAEAQERIDAESIPNPG